MIVFRFQAPIIARILRSNFRGRILLDMAIPAENVCTQIPVYTFLVVSDGLTFCYCPLSQRCEKLNVNIVTKFMSVSPYGNV